MSSRLGFGWQPTRDNLQHIAGLLEASLDPRVSNARQREVAKEIDGLCENGEFAQYLAYLFAEAGEAGASEGLRHMAGLVLLKAVRVVLKKGVMSPSGLAHIKASTLSAMNDRIPVLRKTATNLVSTIVTFSRLADWPELLRYLLGTLHRGGDDSTFGGALLLLEMLCEDCGDQLASEEAGSQPLLDVLPILFSTFKHPNAKFRAQALRCVNYLMILDDMPAALSSQAETLLQGLSMLSRDGDRSVRKEVASGLGYLMDWRSDVVVPHLAQVMNFILGITMDEDDDVAKEAFEFITTLCHKESVDLADILPQYYSQLLPAILQRLQLSQEEIIALGTDAENDASVPDRQEDILPSSYGAGARGGEIAASELSRQSSGAADDEEEEGNEDDEEDEEDGSGSGGYASMWTVRKVSGQALRTIVEVVPPESLLPALLPFMGKTLDVSADWKTREAGLLALGQLGEQSYAGWLAGHGHILGLLQFLLSQTGPQNHTHVRNAALWSLGRFSQWVAEANGSGQPGDGLLREYIVTAVPMTLDRNKLVQNNACSLLSVLAEAAGAALDPYVKDMCPVLLQAYSGYQAKNRKIMLDVLGTLFSFAPKGMCQPDVFSKVVPVLWNDFKSLHPADELRLHYMETFGSIVKEAGVSFADFCPPLYELSMQYIEGTMTQIASAPELGVDSSDIPRDFMVAALDLLSALVEGLGGHFVQLAQFDTFLPMLAEVIRDDDEDSLTTSFALCGDLFQFVPKQMEPLMPKALQTLMPYIGHYEESADVCNNAIWAIGLLSVSCPLECLAPHADGCINRLVQLLLAAKELDLEQSIRNNAAIVLSRIGIRMPERVAVHLHDVGAAWLDTFGNVQRFSNSTESEKRDCLEGFAKTVAQNPAGIAPAFNYLCRLTLRLKNAPQVQRVLAQLITAAKEKLDQQRAWQRTLQSLDAETKKNLQNAGIL